MREEASFTAGRKSGASQSRGYDSFQRRFPSAEPALSLPKGYGMLRDRRRGDGGLGVLR